MIPKAKRKGIYTEVIDITPAMALEILNDMHINRTLHNNAVDAYSDMMKRDMWRHDTLECVKFDEEGHCIDGQHRMWAIDQCGKTVKMMVGFNVPHESYKFLDAGVNRKNADILSYAGNERCSLLATVLKMVKSQEAGNVRYYLRIHNSQIEDVLDSHPKVKDSIDFVIKQKYHKGFIPQSSCVFLHYIFSKKSKELADDFIFKLLSGENMKASDAIYKLRERLLDCMLSKKKFSRFDKLVWCVRVWNALRSGRTLKYIKCDASDEETLPKIL
jgi:hypothetical protein